MEKIFLDDGYNFGLGFFETIDVKNKKALFLDKHFSRINKALKDFGLYNPDFEKIFNEEYINKYIELNELSSCALKISISENNALISHRENPYNAASYKKGFSVCKSNVHRNETSKFTYVKSLNYGDNIIEKRYALKNGYDEPIFLNSKNQICEGATTNIFFVKHNKIFTPKIECGLLNGTIRSFLIEKYDITETILYYDEVKSYDEMFLTNSLMGIMPVIKFDSIIFNKPSVSVNLKKEYSDLTNCI